MHVTSKLALPLPSLLPLPPVSTPLAPLAPPANIILLNSPPPPPPPPPPPSPPPPHRCTARRRAAVEPRRGGAEVPRAAGGPPGATVPRDGPHWLFLGSIAGRPRAGQVGVARRRRASGRVAHGRALGRTRRGLRPRTTQPAAAHPHPDPDPLAARVGEVAGDGQRDLGGAFGERSEGRPHGVAGGVGGGGRGTGNIQL